MSQLEGVEVEYDPFAGSQIARAFGSTAAQREIWLADSLGCENSLAFNESVALTLKGPLDVAAARRAVDLLVQRHEILRATFTDDGLQVLIAPDGGSRLTIEDLFALSAQDRPAALAAIGQRQVNDRFDLLAGPLFHAVLARLDAQDHVLFLTGHHIICDGWSIGVLVREFVAAYTAYSRGESPALPAPDSFGDFAESLAEPKWREAAEDSLQYWVGLYDRHVPVLDLPTDRPRPPGRSTASAREDLLLGQDLVAAVRSHAAKARASLFSTMLGAFGGLMARLSESETVVVGVPAAAQSTHDAQRLVGHCVNLLPVPINIAPGIHASQFFPATQKSVLDAYDHQDSSFGEILGRLRLDRDPARLPLVTVQFNLDARLDPADLAIPGLEVLLRSIPRAFENFELFVNATQSDAGITLECQYSTSLFDAETIRRWLALYRSALTRLVAGGDLALAEMFLPPDSDLDLLRRWNDTGTDPGAFPSTAALLDSAADSRTGPALTCRDVTLTYGQLHARANRLVRALRARGVLRGQLVGLCLERGIDMVVAQLAVLKSGAGYVPLDPGYPRDRLAYMASDARLSLLLTQSALASTIDWPRDRSLWIDDAAQAGADATGAPLAPDPQADASPESPAYVIYTSGSTGKPKGVVVPHGCVVNFLLGVARRPGLSAKDRLVAVTTLSFDIAVLELLLPLAVGAEVVLATREQALDGAALRQLLEASGATTMQATPATWRLLLEAGWSGAPGFRALVGGESLPPDLAESLLTRVAEVWNMYGPTETTVWSTCARITDPRAITVGTPLPNQVVHVLDQQGRQCPIGVAGEMWIGGAGVATGYLNREDLTNERFHPDPLVTKPGARMYRTGDKGRWTHAGLIEHQGRLDSQVKVRGFRIELGEIESQLSTFPGIQESAVLVREDLPGDVRLVAYCVLRGQEMDAATLRKHLQKTLPEYMLPQHFVAVAELPRLPNGKLDRRSLPAPDLSSSGAGFVAPRTELEARLLAAMESVLNLPGIGVSDGFFALGGHSLLAAKLTARINREFGLNLPLRTLFECPTVEQLAGRVQQLQGQPATVAPRIRHTLEQSVGPLTLMQERVRFMEALQPGRVVYNTPSAHRLTGAFDAAAFRRAFAAIVAHQPGLRTEIAATPDGGWVQRVLPEVDASLPLVDLSGIPAPQRETELMRRLQAIIDRPLDIASAPLFAAALFRLAAEEHVFLFMPHHIIWDGWSFDLLYEEISVGYLATRQGREPELKPLEVTYLDFARWHAEWLSGEECDAQVRYWRGRFGRRPPAAAMPADRRRQPGMSGLGAVEWVRVEKDLTERLRALAVAGGATLNMVTLAAHAMLVSQASRESTVILGMPVRGRLIEEAEPVMGFFNNLLPYDVDVRREMPFAEWLGLLRDDIAQAFANQDVPFERLAREPEFAAGARSGALYQSLFSFQDARHRTHDWGGLVHQSVLVMQKGATEDLGLWLMDVPHGLEGGINYNADVFDASTAALFHERYLGLLARIAERPGATVGELLETPGADADRFLQWRDAPRSDAAPAGPAVAAVTPVTSGPIVDERVKEIWSKLLGFETQSLRPTDNFFDLGGNSVLAMQAVADMKRLFGVDVDPRRYLTETLVQLSACLPAADAEPASPQATSLPAKERQGISRLLGLFGRK